MPSATGAIFDNGEIGGRSMADRLETVDEIVAKYAVVSNPVKSKIYVGFGSIFVVFAIIGIWIPGWPTVSWAVPAAFLFHFRMKSCLDGP